jgi:cobalt-zinc-cadmium efflux system outer membrane protein
MIIFPSLTSLKPIFSRFFAPNSMLLLLAIAPLAGAVEQPLPTLSLHEAVTKTLVQNPTLVAFGHQFEAQAGRVLQAGLKPNPEVALAIEDAFGSGELTGMDSAETTLGISWVLEGQQRRERVNAAQARTSVLEVERDIQRLDAAANSARLYMLTLALQTRLQQAEQAINLARTVAAVIAQRVNTGNSPAAESARARVDLSRRLLEYEDIEHELLVAKRHLAAQWGSTQVEFTAVEGALTQLPKVANYSELKSRLDQNPRLQYFVTSERWEASQLALAKAQSKPQWQLSAGVKYLSATDEQALVTGISVPLGVFDRQQGRIAEARALMALNRAEREAKQIQLDAALYGTHQELLHNLHIVNAYQEEILPALATAITETRRAYDLGRYSYLEWQAVQRDYLDAQNTLIDASLAAHLKAIELERLTGVAIAPAAVNANTNQ